MIINIIRGQHQIGGSIIEIKTEKAKVIFDIGINLDESHQDEYPNVNGLFEGEKQYDAVFISHYHADHVGLMDKLLPDIPVYMGQNAYQILCASNEYRHIETGFIPLFIKHGVSIWIGDMEIIPFSCDHSAYDSYMFLIKCRNKIVLYSGDFRANGRMDYHVLLEELPQVDVLIVEGTTLIRDVPCGNIEENTLERIAVNELMKHEGPCFVMMSAMNIDRLITMYNVAQKTGRVLLEDLYTAQIVGSIQSSVPKPDKEKGIRVFATDGNPERYKKLNSFGKAKIGKNAIIREKYIMCVRPSMINYLRKLEIMRDFQDGILFYGMWKGYQEKKEVADFLRFMQESGVKLHTLHTSGHADTYTIDKLIADVKPKIIMPVHTENEKWFDKYKDSITIEYNSKILEI